MAKPELPMVITLNDLVKCGEGCIIVSMLIDAKAFFYYDQREMGNYFYLKSLLKTKFIV
jgi:serine/threonine-protein phosphatase 2A regulatory subunit B''